MSLRVIGARSKTFTRRAGRGASVRLLVRTVAAVGVAALILSACGSAQPGAAPPRSKGRSAPATSAARLTLSSAAPSVNQTAFRQVDDPWGTVSYNPYSSGYVGIFDEAQLALAYIRKNPGKGPYGSFFRELATGWKLSPTAITFSLRRSARWQNGEAFTSRDVLTSMLLAGADYNSTWEDISSVTTPTAHRVVVHLNHGSVPEDVLINIVQMSMLPASQYAPLIPAGFQQDLVTYWRTYDPLHPTTATVARAGAGPAGQVIAKTDKRLASFKPSKLLGDGPYELSAANTSEVLLKKWSGWWDAKAITAPWMEDLAMPPNSVYGALLSGRVDFQHTTVFNDTEATALDRTPQRRYVMFRNPQQVVGVLFHLGSYPFNLLGVRQAIAYVINRTKLTELDVGGSFAQNPPDAAPDGLPYLMNKRYLTSAQFSSLKRYAYNPARAAKILDSLHFVKKKGVWYMPNGKPFSMILYEPSGGPLVLDGVIIAKMLQAFGIKATTDVVEATTFWGDQADGDYPISGAWLDSGVVNPLSWFSSGFLSFNYPATYSGVGKCNCHVAMGVGPIAEVPGLGKTNLSVAINKEVSTAPRQDWSRYVWDWARFVNDNLPMLPLWDNSQHMAYSSARYTDWPRSSDLGLWNASAPLPILFMQHGFLKPTRSG